MFREPFWRLAPDLSSSHLCCSWHDHKVATNYQGIFTIERYFHNRKVEDTCMILVLVWRLRIKAWIIFWFSKKCSEIKGINLRKCSMKALPCFRELTNNCCWYFILVNSIKQAKILIGFCNLSSLPSIGSFWSKNKSILVKYCI